MMMMMIIEYLPRIRNRMSFSGAYPGLFLGRVGAQLFYFNANKPPSFFPEHHLYWKATCHLRERSAFPLHALLDQPLL